ncbi:HAMP domain-containing histidine kinase [Lachnospiraceae bacterium CLA-AA-H246]|uniref:histidine kinase n=1 Tax=Hominisplanchenecus faecis TaxID=2885351 RepID=A0ABS8EXQ2_9FIRM|nr:HAMP domain-containing sensor histidine kinase [Hominisplanchenecus faecis]MCC2149202.1 HAMP domain-containing histidine kinase [Hominisplanchenecus faecis]MCM0706791.1 HAMP domain-containing histidine kinase [Faecalicatena sp. BF-R-105]
MKNKYRRLKWKMMLQTMGIMMMSLVVGKMIVTLILDGLFQGKLLNLIIGILMKMNLSQAEADVIYQNIFRANRDVFQWIGFMLLFLVGYYAALSKTANYLKNIGDGIDNVLSNSKQPIELETELEPIAEKLNTMKMTLARKERMAQESEQRKNDLVVYLAHDLKTPLTSVIAYLSMLDEKPDMPPEERKKYIHIAHTKAIRLSELISEFFEITKFNLQNIRLEKETINLSLMLEQIMDEFYAVFADNNLTGNIYTEEDLMVEGDPDKLARVFDNLLRNAVAYSYRGTNIDVRAYGEGVAVVIVFSNQGEPIPKQKLQTVFEKFYRADNSRSSQTGGAGLGLSVAKEIVELHEGTIEAFSDIQSTRFVVRLKRLLPKGQRQSGGVI